MDASSGFHIKGVVNSAAVNKGLRCLFGTVQYRFLFYTQMEDCSLPGCTVKMPPSCSLKWLNHFQLLELCERLHCSTSSSMFGNFSLLIIALAVGVKCSLWLVLFCIFLMTNASPHRPKLLGHSTRMISLGNICLFI